jgi:opacity protein-like surface antigen
MRSHLDPRCVLVVTAMVVVLGLGGVAEAAPFVNRPLTLSRSDWTLDFGVGAHHVRNPDFTGFGLNFELGIGLTSFLQLGVRTGVRIGNEGRATQADYFGRTFETETYGTAHGTVANPEVMLRWSLVHSTAELGLEGRLYLPTEEGSDVGIMLGVPVAIHIGGAARLDTGLYVPIIFSDSTRTLVSIPAHLWFQASHQLYLGPLTGVRFHDPGTSVPLGFGLGYSVSYDIDLRTWLLFPNVKSNARNFGFGGGMQVRF